MRVGKRKKLDENLKENFLDKITFQIGNYYYYYYLSPQTRQSIQHNHMNANKCRYIRTKKYAYAYSKTPYIYSEKQAW